MGMVGEHWSTAHELDFLDGIGSYRKVAPGLDRKASIKEQGKWTRAMLQERAAALEKYLAAAQLRKDWGKIDVGDVLAYAAARLAETAHQLGRRGERR